MATRWWVVAACARRGATARTRWSCKKSPAQAAARCPRPRPRPRPRPLVSAAADDRAPAASGCAPGRAHPAPRPVRRRRARPPGCMGFTGCLDVEGCSLDCMGFAAWVHTAAAWVAWGCSRRRRARSPHRARRGGAQRSPARRRRRPRSPPPRAPPPPRPAATRRRATARSPPGEG